MHFAGAGGSGANHLPTVTAGTQQLQEILGAYGEAGIGEFILPEWNLGTGQRRRDTLDRFLAEVAAPFRSGV